jgi:hypothetical protein
MERRKSSPSQANAKRDGLGGAVKAQASPELTGGAGFTFEDAVAAVYAASLLTENTALGLSGRRVTRVSLQQSSLGQPLDDVVVEAEGGDNVRMRLSLQVKRKMVVSAAVTNTDFKDIVLSAHSTVAQRAFTASVDRVGAVVGENVGARTGK